MAHRRCTPPFLPNNYIFSVACGWYVGATELRFHTVISCFFFLSPLFDSGLRPKGTAEHAVDEGYAYGADVLAADDFSPSSSPLPAMPRFPKKKKKKKTKTETQEDILLLSFLSLLPFSPGSYVMMIRKE